MDIHAHPPMPKTTGYKITRLKNELLSHLLPKGSLILAVSIIGYVIISNILERWVLRALYGNLYKHLEKPENERRRRSFNYFHMGAMTMFILLLMGGYPVLYFLVGSASFSTPYGRKNNGITVGDMMFVVAEVYNGYYLFELCFRTKWASYIAIAHHIGLLVITQVSLSIFSHPEDYPEATLEFYMCMLWGMFDVVVELPIYLSMVIWRLKRDSPRLLSRMTYACAIWGTCAAMIELAVTIFLLNRSWALWDIKWKIITPLVFSLWIATQLYSAFRLFQMGRSEHLKYRKQDLGIDFGESATASLGKATLDTVTGYRLTKQSAAYVRT